MHASTHYTNNEDEDENLEYPYRERTISKTKKIKRKRGGVLSIVSSRLVGFDSLSLNFTVLFHQIAIGH